MRDINTHGYDLTAILPELIEVAADYYSTTADQIGVVVWVERDWRWRGNERQREYPVIGLHHGANGFLYCCGEFGQWHNPPQRDGFKKDIMLMRRIHSGAKHA